MVAALCQGICEMFCPTCLAPVGKEDRFCSRCGATLPVRTVPITGSRSGSWESREFVRSLNALQLQFYGPSLTADECPPEISRIIETAVRELSEMVARENWEPAEPTDALSLWRAGRIQLNDSLNYFHHTLTLIALRMLFRRWVLIPA